MSTKIRIRQVMIDGEMRPAVVNVSLGQTMVQAPQVVDAVDLRGEPYKQHVPGRSVCTWLVPQGRAQPDDVQEMNHPTHRDVEVADVDDAIAQVLVDERGWCERVAGRPRKDALTA